MNIPKCQTCKDAGYISVKGTEHIGPDGNVDYDIIQCIDCKNTIQPTDCKNTGIKDEQ